MLLSSLIKFTHLFFPVFFFFILFSFLFRLGVSFPFLPHFSFCFLTFPLLIHCFLLALLHALPSELVCHFSPAFSPSPPLLLLTSLSIPSSPTLFSTLCRLGFKQAGSYQATGYMLIGSISASISLPGSCTGLTAVMYCWLLIARSLGGLADEMWVRHPAIILFSG